MSNQRTNRSTTMECANALLETMRRAYPDTCQTRAADLVSMLTELVYADCFIAPQPTVRSAVERVHRQRALLQSLTEDLYSVIQKHHSTTAPSRETDHD